MELNRALPKDIARRITEAIGVSEPRYALEGDLALDGRYGTAWLVLSGGHLVACDANLLTKLPLADVKEVRVDELFGGARLIAETDESEHALISYTKAHVPEFAALCRVLNDVIKGREPVPPEEVDHAYCVSCGAPLPERGVHCPKCVPRWTIFRRLVDVMLPYKWRAILMVAATLVTVAAQLVPPLCTKMIVDEVIKKSRADRLWLWVALMLGAGAVLLVSEWIKGALGAWLGGRMTADLRHQLHAHLQRLRMRYFGKQDSGELISRVMHDTSELRGFLIEGLPFLMVNVLSFVAIASVLLALDWPLAVIVFLPVPFLVGGGSWFWKRLVPMFHKYGTRRAKMHTILNESIHGIKSVKALTQEAARTSRFGTANEGLFGVGVSIEQTFVGFFQVMFWLMSVGTVAVWYVATRRIVDGDPNLSLGDLLAFVQFIALFYGPLKWFTAIINWMTHAFASAERIFAVLDSPPEVYEAPDAVDLPRLAGGITFEDVRFSYERGKEVLKGVSFDVTPGEMIGLVGKSGAGKSTIINLICRFYDVDSGRVRIDGHPIDKLKLETLRRGIGIVMQEPFLFNGTIAENIRYGLPEASFDDVVRAARAAHAHEFIVDKEDGYDTVIGEGGAALSGGEKQRVAIARAILLDPAILILDEATSSVDSETEKAIQQAIANLVKDRTTVAIAHRLATLRNAHRLVVIEDGRIAEIGSHDELLDKGGLYANLVKIQTELSALRGNVWEE